MIEIKELDINELDQAFPIVSQLRTHLSLDEYVDLIKRMKPNGYQIFCLFENGEIVSYAGIAILTNLYYGEHI